MAKTQISDKLEVVNEVKTDKQEKKEKNTKKVNKKKEKKHISNPFKEMYAELKKVTWPTRKELINYCVCVGIFVVVMALVVAVMDLGSAYLIDFLTNAENGLPSFF